MAPLETLFRLEVEFHRKLRTEAPATTDPAAVHTSYAVQHGYEGLLRGVGKASGQDVDRLTGKLTLLGDTRDVFAARDSVKQLLGIPWTDGWGR